MARQTYKGFNLPDGAEIPDVPADLRTLVDGGPIPRFATAAARAAAITAPVDGLMTYQQDTRRLEVYDSVNARWALQGATGVRIRGGSIAYTTDGNGGGSIPLSPPLATFISVVMSLGDNQNGFIIEGVISHTGVGVTELWTAAKQSQSPTTPHANQVVRINWLLLEYVIAGQA